MLFGCKMIVLILIVWLLRFSYEICLVIGEGFVIMGIFIIIVFLNLIIVLLYMFSILWIFCWVLFKKRVFKNVFIEFKINFKKIINDLKICIMKKNSLIMCR